MTGTNTMHTAALVQSLARSLIRQGYDIGNILRECSFDLSLLNAPSPMAKLPDSLQFFERAAQLTKNDTLGLQFGIKQDIRPFGLICYVGLASPNLAGFLSNYTRYVGVLSGVLKIDDSVLLDKGLIEWTYDVSPALERCHYVEASAVSFMQTLRQNSDKSLSPRRVKFQHNRRHHLDEVEAYFGGRVEFGADCNGFEFELQDLELPLTSSDQALLKVLTGYADQVLAEKDKPMPDLILEVERAIADQLASGSASLGTVASEIGMSPRTLSRKLAAEGTSFFRLLEGLRKSLSKSYLRETDLVLAEIAFLLGYSGISSFNDAFKRWTGDSPGQFRAA